MSFKVRSFGRDCLGTAPAAHGRGNVRPRPMAARIRRVTRDEFKRLLQGRQIRPASLEDVNGTHHKRPLYIHPNTGQYFVQTHN